MNAQTTRSKWHSKHRGPLAITAIAAVALAVGGWAIAGPDAGASIPSVLRPAEKSKSDVLKDVSHLEGQKNIVAPDSSAALSSLKDSDLRRHGVYRVVSPDFVGLLSKTDTGRRQPQGVRSHDPSILRASPLYVAVKGLPIDFTQTGIDTGDGDSNSVVRQTFAGADSKRRTLEVVRVARNAEPLDVFEPPADQSGWLALSTIMVGLREGILFSPTAASPIPANAQLVRVQFFANGVETFLTATGLTPAEVIDLATRLAGATS